MGSANSAGAGAATVVRGAATAGGDAIARRSASCSIAITSGIHAGPGAISRVAEPVSGYDGRPRPRSCGATRFGATIRT